MSRGPFAGWAPARRRRAAAALGVAGAAQLAVFSRLEREMKRTGGGGIIPFELAGTPERAALTMTRWGVEGRRAARQSLMLDFLFPPTYATQQALFCQMVAGRLAAQGARPLAAAAAPLAWGQLAAAGFDYIENLALLLVLTGRTGRAPAIARRAALIKFVLIGAGLGYVGLGIAVGRLRPNRP